MFVRNVGLLSLRMLNFFHLEGAQILDDENEINKKQNPVRISTVRIAEAEIQPTQLNVFNVLVILPKENDVKVDR